MPAEPANNEGPDRILGGLEGAGFMHRSTLTLLLSGAIGLLATGCASTTPEIRGQGPGEWTAGPVSVQGCPSCQGTAGHGGHVVHSQNCPHSGACQTGSCNLPFFPVHRNFYTYTTPDGLSYPPQNAPPAVYQYPYYTLRGPTDFFMK